MAHEFIIDGSTMTDLDGFYAEVGRVLFAGNVVHNLDALADMLGGGFGTPAQYSLRWVHAGQARTALGHAETVRFLERKLATVHESNHAGWTRRLDEARAGIGPTLFDQLLSLMRDAGVPVTLEE